MADHPLTEHEREELTRLRQLQEGLHALEEYAETNPVHFLRELTERCPSLQPYIVLPLLPRAGKETQFDD
jgi:hypothetical protein